MAIHQVPGGHASGSSPKHKDHTGPTKDLLQKALRCLPQDFALREARRHISLALHNIEHVEKKRSKRTSQERQASPATPNLVFYPAEALGVIEQMIESENQKLEDLKAAQKKDSYVSDSEFALLG